MRLLTPVGATSIDTTTKTAGAQTQFLPQPGAASFKRLSEPSPGSQVINSERRTACMLWVAEAEVKEEQDYAPVLRSSTGEREFTLLTPVAS